MKTLGSAESLGALISTRATSDEQSQRNGHVYSGELQSMLDVFDEEGCVDELGHVAEKKRRLSVEQVKALDKNFEVENKLEPERKVKLARELGLQPRQVAVWFQNRRARWKTKQLERDYVVLKANYDALKRSYESLQLHNEALLKQIGELKAKLEEDKTESNHSGEEEVILPAGSQTALIEETEHRPHNHESFNNGGEGRCSDSDSSAISSPVVLQNRNFMAASPPPSSAAALKLNCSSSSLNYLQFQKGYQAPLYQKMEEHNFFSGDETCNFFSDDQPPTLHWWN